MKADQSLRLQFFGCEDRGGMESQSQNSDSSERFIQFSPKEEMDEMIPGGFQTPQLHIGEHTAVINKRFQAPPSIVFQVTKLSTNDQPTTINVSPPPVVPMVDQNDEDESPQDTPPRTNRTRAIRANRNRVTRANRTGATRANRPNVEAQNRRGNARNFTQNQCSTIRTKVSHVLSLAKIYGNKNAIAADYNDFLKKNKVKFNNQLCLLFLYLYLRRKNVNQSQVRQIAEQITHYLTDRQSLIQEDEVDRAKIITKIKGNIKVLQELFTDYPHKEIDLAWAEGIYGPMFIKKQTNAINQPLGALRTLLGQNNPITNTPVIPDSSWIEDCFSLFSSNNHGFVQNNQNN